MGSSIVAYGCATKEPLFDSTSLLRTRQSVFVILCDVIVTYAEQNFASRNGESGISLIYGFLFLFMSLICYGNLY